MSRDSQLATSPPPGTFVYDPYTKEWTPCQPTGKRDEIILTIDDDDEPQP